MRSLLLLVLPIVVLSSCSQNKLRNHDVTIEIIVKDGLFKEFIIGGYPFLENRIIIDSSGIGKIALPVKYPLFATILYGNNETLPIILTPEKDLKISLIENEVVFEGKGAELNTYLSESEILFQQFSDSIDQLQGKEESPKEVIRSYKSFEESYKKFHENYSDRLSFSREIDHILRNNFKAFSLLKKQYYLESLNQTIIDSLNIESELHISDNALYKDTLLIKTNSSHFRLFLSNNLNYRLKKNIPFKDYDLDSFPVAAINYILNTEFYSESIKEYLSFDLLFMMINGFGYRNSIGSLSDYLTTRYPDYIYLKNLTKLRDKFDGLSLGKAAPNFKAISKDGDLYSLKDFDSKIVFIGMWATWCAPCIKGFAHVKRLQEEFENKDIVFLFINRDNNDKKWKQFLNTNPDLTGIHLKVISPSFEKDYRVTGIPRYIILDKGGKIVDAFARPSKQGVKETLQGLLN